jgi:uncharacterized phage-associated protein
MPYSAKAIANYFLDLAKEHGETVSPMKIQKLVYFAHGWHLAILGTPLIDEQIEAWKFGPVIRSLYSEFKQFGNQPIEGHAAHYRLVPGARPKLEVSHPRISKSADTQPTRDLLRRVWEVYSPYTAVQLSNLTHQDGTPWKAVMDHYRGDAPKGTDIPADSIQKYFSSL